MRTCKRLVKVIDWMLFWNRSVWQVWRTTWSSSSPNQTLLILNMASYVVCLFALFVLSLPFVHSCRRGFSFFGFSWYTHSDVFWFWKAVETCMAGYSAKAVKFEEWLRRNMRSWCKMERVRKDGKKQLEQDTWLVVMRDHCLDASRCTGIFYGLNFWRCNCNQFFHLFYSCSCFPNSFNLNSCRKCPVGVISLTICLFELCLT